MAQTKRPNLERNEISITHFLSPQRFWYQKIDTPFKNNLQTFQKLERDLLEHFKGKTISQTYAPRAGDWVAVRFISWQKIIRGRIENIVQFSRSDPEYVIWALDYGFPFQSRVCYIYRLPEQFSTYFDRIHCGAIANVVPAEIEFDFVNEKGKLVEQESWTKRAIETLDKLITDAASVIFIEEYKSHDNSINFGDLKIVNHTAKEFLGSQLLLAINVAVHKPNFRCSLSTLKTIRVPSWQTTETNLKLIDNSLRHANSYPKNSLTTTNSSRNECDELAKLKVEDWCARNEKFKPILEKQNAQTVSEEIDHGFDIGFEDSVSLIDQKAIKEKDSQNQISSSNIKENFVGTRHLEQSNGTFSIKLSEEARNQLSEDALYALEEQNISETAKSKNPHLEKLRRRAEESSDRNSDVASVISKSTRIEQLMQLRRRHSSNVQSSVSVTPKRVEDRENLASTATNVTTMEKPEDYTNDDKKYNQSAENEKNDLSLHSEESFETTKSVSSKGMERLIEMKKRLSVSRSENSSDELNNSASAVQKTIATMPNLPRTHRDNDKNSANKEISQSKLTKIKSLREKLINKQKELQQQMIPAGFDITNLQKYKKEDSHWHRKETTRGEFHPHEDIDKSAAQDFRHTRSHSDKYKKETKEIICDADKGINTDTVRDQVSTENVPPRQLLVQHENDSPNDISNQTLAGNGVVSSPEIKNKLDLPSETIDQLPIQETEKVSVINIDANEVISSDTIKDQASLEYLSPKKLSQIENDENAVSSPEINKNSDSPSETISQQQLAQEIENLSLAKINSNEGIDSDTIGDQISPENLSPQKQLSQIENDSAKDPFIQTLAKNSVISSPEIKNRLDLPSETIDQLPIQETEKFSITNTDANKGTNSDQASPENVSPQKVLSQIENDSPKDNSINSIEIKTNSDLLSEKIDEQQLIKETEKLSMTKIYATEDLRDQVSSENISPQKVLSQFEEENDLPKDIWSAGIKKNSDSPSETIDQVLHKKTVQLSKQSIKDDINSIAAKQSNLGVKNSLDPLTSENKNNTTLCSSLPSNEAHPSMSRKKMSDDLSKKEKAPKTLAHISHRMREFPGEAKIKTNLSHHLVLVHGKTKVKALDEIAQACFSQEIMQEMQKLNLTKMFRIQAYTWSHLVRGNSLFLVSPAQSAKTWSYIPPICSLISHQLEEGTIPETYGPVAIILVTSSVQAEIIGNHCRRILCSTKINISIVRSYTFRYELETRVQLHNGCGILIVTPSNLLRLLNNSDGESLIDPCRLKHFIIDDLDIMLSRSKTDFEAVLKLMLKKAPNQLTIPFQLIVTSREWHSMFVKLIRISNQPLLCFGDYLEAAVYGKVKISIKLRSKNTKIDSVLSFIKKHSFEMKRLLIVCNSDEDLDDVVQVLTGEGYPCLSYHSLSSSALLRAVEEWKSKIICNQILVCTDTVLPEMLLQNVQNLIHYSMPKSWTKFIFRFSVFYETYENFLEQNFPTTIDENKIANSLILLDEENNIQLPSLLEFMKKHHQTKYVHGDILAVGKNIIKKREESQALKGTPICPATLEFGNCDAARCQYRHNPTGLDGAYDGVPKSGDLRVHILKVFSPTHYTARLLEHKPKGSTKWEIIRRSNESAHFSLQMNLYYMNSDNHIIHWPLNFGDMCIYQIIDHFYRCRIIEVPSVIKNQNVVRSVNVKVKLIDVGTVLACDSAYLFQCAEKFKQFPPQAADIRLLGVVPFDNERVWDSKATQAVVRWIQTDVTKEECVHISINFALMDTIWVNNVIVMEKLQSVGKYIYKANVRRSLVGKKLALICKKTNPLREIAEELGLIDQNEINLDQSFEDSNENQENHKDVVKSSEESLKTHQKIVDEMNATENCKDFDDSPKSSLNRDDTALSKNSQVVETKSKSLLEKPLMEQWDGLPLNEATQVEFENCENGKWDDFFLYNQDSTVLDKYEKLLNIIEEHIEKVENESIDEDWLVPMQNCLIKFKDSYCRAKIHSVFCSESGKVYRIFICDYGCYSLIDSKNLSNASLHTTSKRIVEFMPFQAIRCKLVGIQLKHSSPRYELSSQNIFALAVRECYRDDLFNTRSFEIILYECDGNVNLCEENIVNHKLVRDNFATYDEDTRHFLELEAFKVADINNGALESAAFEEFIKRFETNFIMPSENVDELLEDKNLKTDEKLQPISTNEEIPNEKITGNQPNNKDDHDHDHSSPIAALKSFYKRPKTIWFDTDFIICISIEAPDVRDYFLEVTCDRVIFAADIHDEKKALILNLLGTIDEKYVSHEIRGCNVNLLLVKSVFMKWPRLLVQPIKCPWLFYHSDAIQIEESYDEQLPEQRPTPHTCGVNQLDFRDSGSDTDESESNLFQTFEPIVNSEDVHDPSSDLY